MDDELLPAIQKAYDINCWLLQSVARLPKSYKFTLGDRLQLTALDLNLALIEAAHSRAKERPLYRANRLLDQLRVLLRLARDVGALTARQHEHASRWSDELGRMIGDDLFAPYERSRGLPIGNLTSQLWANTYLAGFDHWVKQQLGVRAYLRFVDDFVLLHDSKAVLSEWAGAVRAKLETVRLRAHPTKCVIRRTSEGVPFLGYVVWPDRIRVRGDTMRRFRRRYRRCRATDPDTARSSLLAWRGHVQLAGTWRRKGMV